METRTIRHATIKNELAAAVGDAEMQQTICLFHSPPYDCALDRAALDGKFFEHAPLAVHVGSIAIRDFLTSRQPLLSLHGHVHESTRLTGHWRKTIGTTWAINGAHDGQELSLIRFDPDCPAASDRTLV
ncbi:hypothetical protein COW53_06225 [bacterium CG17_big_fil_post_rev_8_21_14_2_50_64_8]|nr:MAG: hypothetical protein COW53_06225 [bacterium CG17_big_fil_post_rev_8_21_14_2_50_64_8]PJA75128.1 MAG: hypothetical protein CO151_07370 [bacterium CG_4_9_14_3_um_filter_65_15]